MLKITKVQLIDNERLELKALDTEKKEHTFELLMNDLPMLLQMLVAAKQQKIRNDSKKGDDDPELLLNFVEGWQVFSLPDEMPQGIGVHFQCVGGFDFAFALTDEEEKYSSKEFQNDLQSLMQVRATPEKSHQ